MKKIVFASANAHKIEEVSHKLGGLPLLGLKDINCNDDIPETASTLEGNAILKARYIWERYKIPVFADDTGLEIAALNNEPGVYSARYAGNQKDSAANRKLVLDKMQKEVFRTARFRTVICYIQDGQEFLFEGIVEGHILREERGTQGFGYDSIFIPKDNSRTFAQMSIEEKSLLSHRAKALEKFKRFLDK
ncbi:MAG: RdgB/HAM1 family non-canonical purine NTP pyrophosphatase [Flavobacteriales bacterium]|jgi:XTP/dITP diphosphohydrolase